VRLRVVPVAKLFEDYCSGKKPFDVLVGYGWLADAPDGFAMVGLPFSGPQSSVNCSGYRSRSLDRAIARAQLAPAGEAYDAAWAAIDRRILEAAPAVPFAWDRDSVVRSADVRGEVSGFSRLWDLSTLSVGG
jgi:peptide/nickel transport system substrate-binding protein